MKKIITLLVVVAMVTGMTFAVVSAQGPQGVGGSDNGNAAVGQAGSDVAQQAGSDVAQQAGSDVAQQAVSEAAKLQNTEMNQRFEGFAQNKFDASELVAKAKNQLENQRMITEEFKQELKQIHEKYRNMGEEERSMMGQEIAALRNQIKEAHKYELQINAAQREQAKRIIRECIAAGVPAEEELEAVLEILEEL